MTISELIGQFQNPSKRDFATPYDSSYGVPKWFIWLAVVVIGYIVLRVYLGLKKEGYWDRQNKNEDSEI